jgi:hypothetical protein
MLVRWQTITRWRTGLWVVLVASGLIALVASAAHNLYEEITARNVFGLKPPAPPPPAVATAPPVDLTLTGITTFGRKRALINVATGGAKTNAPAHVQSVVLAEGQRDGPVEVLHIDPKAHTVEVNDGGKDLMLGFAPGRQMPIAAASPPPPTPTTAMENAIAGALRRTVRSYAPQ